MSVAQCGCSGRRPWAPRRDGPGALTTYPTLVVTAFARRVQKVCPTPRWQHGLLRLAVHEPHDRRAAAAAGRDEHRVGRGCGACTNADVVRAELKAGVAGIDLDDVGATGLSKSVNT